MTIEIRVERTIRGPAEAVFDALADHARWSRFPPIGASRVLQPGAGDPRGLGALREIRSPGFRVLEEITAFDPPRAYEYRIREATLPIAHELGRIALHASGDATRVEWTSRFRVALPLVGGLLEPVFRYKLTGAFTEILATVAGEVER